ncbi:MAG TPA: TolC family outer membrane protein [Rhodocyclaceae bacterium]|uniref:TolC family outer membrane protein n=1 Tax=Accumulibacter sp. TaxID=2053492 RepID=UPI002B865285|nr:TolC family outer membrane protein [Accumulibacter sp.]HMZ83736.1 TolC family outer membrane protein [Rhodocyclaceae bacterium]HNA03787.1 TolC family outer membrane protein [Rhodocyclaceae bacterium]HNB77886.1 TolC family outer membrane protein [Rhodocyclaceae bacterium]HNC60165.1 TolC family outer membrane protein [Rhodocyclaceae bacterium]HNG88039.1 TolC family outer membrane protein [Accumulibacter sp.]
MPSRIGIAGALIAGLFAALPASAADLLQMYRDALANDSQFAAARAQLDAGRERIPQGRAGLLPAVGLNANTNWNDVDIKQPISAERRFNSNGYALQLTQPLFRWQNLVQYDQSKLQVAQAEAVFAQARQDLILRVSQAYFDVLLAQDTLTVAQVQKKAIAEQLEQARRNFEVGTSTIVDTHEAQSRYDLTVAQEIAAQSDLDVKRQALRQLIGKEPEALKALKSVVQISRPQPDDIQQWVGAAEQNSFAVQAQQAGLEVATREIERQRAGHYPTVDLVASHNRSKGLSSSGVSLGTAESSSNVVGLQLAVPLYQGGLVMSREREAVALKEKASGDLETTRRAAALSARQAYLGVSSGTAQVKALEAALVSSQSALDSNKLGYEVGVRINIDVLNAQQQLYTTRRDLFKARYDTLLAQLRLKAAAGALGEDDVQQINALLEP